MKFLQRSAVAFVMLAMASVCFARSWQVNNNPNVIADFTDINAALSSADVVAGDTLYIGAGAVLGTQTITKAVTVIGTGWDYNDSPAVPGKINGNITLSADGIKLLGIYVSGTAYVKSSNITLERCFIGSTIAQSINQLTDNVRILSCRFAGLNANDNKYNSAWEIRNNIIQGTQSTKTGFIRDLYNATVMNNVIVSNNVANSEHYFIYNCNYSVFKNNVLYCIGNTDVTVNEPKYFFNYCTSSIITNNVMSLASSAASSFPNNIFTDSTDRAVVFKCAGSASSGEYYSLKEDSPAIGAGEGGIDCGAMVGTYKFVPFGRPDNIPVIKELVVPSTPTNGEINVTVGF